jgi:hypothetical protein
MRTLRFAAMGILAVVAGVFGWRAIRNRPHLQVGPLPAQTSATQSGTSQAQNPVAQTPSASLESGKSPTRLGPFTVAGQDYNVELVTRKIRPGSNDDSGDTVVSMQIQNPSGAVQYRRTFPYVEAKEDYFESWSVSAQPLVGANGAGLLVSYDTYSEPSAPEEEPIRWFQIFGVIGGKLVPFGAPLEVQGGLLDENSVGHSYTSTRAMGTEADVVEFKVWTGHCRLIFPVRVDWVQGKLTPAQDCATSAGVLSDGCQYKVVPEDKLYAEGITFVRLWPNPDEKSGPPMKAVIKKNSKVEIVTALVSTQWSEEGTPALSTNSKGPLADARWFGLADDSDLWLKVRIDGREGWIHSEEDFRALGLPEDE